MGLYLAIEGAQLQQNSPAMTQLLFPNLQFTCSGTINSLTVVATSPSGGFLGVPEIQVWRLNESSSNTYSQVDSVKLSTDLIQGVSAEPAVHRLDVSLSFSSGDLLGVFYPHQSSIQLLSLVNHGSEFFSKELDILETPPDSLQLENTTHATGRQWPLVALSEGERVHV